MLNPEKNKQTRHADVWKITWLPWPSFKSLQADFHMCWRKPKPATAENLDRCTKKTTYSWKVKCGLSLSLVNKKVIFCKKLEAAES